ncbi:DNA-directed RNA polymerase III subunit RPC8 [Zootermopsis nevadensis]|uniref:DNA-directed RNA polymerase III subunit RPC8 n=1 Tax=Zootermopsis nevadensis TaxID=136037 RepID=A0A067R5A3_ZOONE|nr:DNA-directed RNA polymerase III subunit RPC8 [Zootermopsis nevadensis]KDR14462.1 DNA-directed RNA polymerase III subunit RPC8 [Zootermopsis nevadensis]
MFVLAEMKHVIRTPPHIFHLKLNDAIAEELNKKLANKVVLNVGLCIALHDITQLEDSYIFPGDGAAHTKVNFRYVVFRPFIEEVITGKIRSCSREGVHVTLGFFDDIIIPPNALQHPSRFDETEQAWVWEYNTGDGDKHDLFMDPGETIRFRVTAETFVETSPSGPENTDITTPGGETSAEEPKVPYMLTGSINESGLGLLSWWASS